MKQKRMFQEEEKIKGPWTEHEDVQLAFCVNLLGDRRWDFIAKLSGLKVGGRHKIGLKRTGKSCRLRWLNYLHPGLKRGKMTSQEEQLVLQLHSKWGNRWSRIARKLPGRTDNEIKNFWRSHMRKKAQEMRKKGEATSPSVSNSSYSSNYSSQVDVVEAKAQSFYDTGCLVESPNPSGLVLKTDDEAKNLKGEKEAYNLMDEIWNDDDIAAFSGDEKMNPVFDDTNIASSPLWDYCPDSLWLIDPQESANMIFPVFSCEEEEEGSGLFAV